MSLVKPTSTRCFLWGFTNRLCDWDGPVHAGILKIYYLLYILFVKPHRKQWVLVGFTKLIDNSFARKESFWVLRNYLGTKIKKLSVCPTQCACLRSDKNLIDRPGFITNLLAVAPMAILKERNRLTAQRLRSHLPAVIIGHASLTSDISGPRTHSSKRCYIFSIHGVYFLPPKAQLTLRPARKHHLGVRESVMIRLL